MAPRNPGRPPAPLPSKPAWPAVPSAPPAPATRPAPTPSPTAAAPVPATPPAPVRTAGALPPPLHHGRVGSVELPGMGRFTVSWVASPDGLAVSGLVRSATNGQEEPYHLDATNRRKWMQLGQPPATLELELHLHQAPRVEFRAEVQMSPSTVQELVISEWLTEQPAPPIHLDHDEAAGVVIENPAEKIEILSYLVMQHVQKGGASSGTEGRFIFHPEAAPTVTSSATEAPAPAASAPPDASATASPAPPAQAAAAPAGEPAPPPPSAPISVKELVALHQAFSRLTGPVELPKLAQQAQEKLGQPLGAWLDSSAAKELLASLWTRTLDHAAQATGRTQEGDALIFALRAFAFLQRLQRGDVKLADEKTRKQALAALVVLPRALLPDSVPLPGADPQSPPGDDVGWTQLLGFGLLKLVRQQLRGYEPGEIAYTLNVMPGEKRILSERFHSRSEEHSRREREAKDEKLDAHEGHTDLDLRKEVEALAASDTLTRDFQGVTYSYGSNGLTLTLGGTATDTLSANDTLTTQDTHLVHRMLHLATQRMEARLGVQRERRLSEEYERLTRAVHDNRGRDVRQVGIYQWLKKIYRMSFDDRGARLIVEILVPRPASALLEVLEPLGRLPPPPLPPERFWVPIHSHRDIDDANYKLLEAYYRVEGLTPPPQEGADQSPPSGSMLWEVWQLRVYEAVLEAYRRCCRLWYESCWRLLRECPWSLRELEHEALKSKGIAALQALHPRPEDEQPPYLRFFDAAFEWKDMAYRFYPWGTGNKPAEPPFDWMGLATYAQEEDTRFLRFLRAGSARMLVPVAPSYWLPVAYYFAFGQLPPWGPGEVPVPEVLVDLLTALLESMERKHPEDTGGWRVEVPTSLLYLREGSSLPEIRR